MCLYNKPNKQLPRIINGALLQTYATTKTQSHLNQKRSVQQTQMQTIIQVHTALIQTKVSLAAYTVRFDYICTYNSVCTLYANYNQDIKFPYIIKIYCFKGLDSVSTAITSPPVSQKSVWPAKLQYAMRAKLQQSQLVVARRGSVKSQTIFALQHTTSSSSRVHVAALHRHGRGREHGLHGRSRLAATAYC